MRKKTDFYEWVDDTWPANVNIMNQENYRDVQPHW